MLCDTNPHCSQYHRNLVAAIVVYIPNVLFALLCWVRDCQGGLRQAWMPGCQLLWRVWCTKQPHDFSHSCQQVL